MIVLFCDDSNDDETIFFFTTRPEKWQISCVQKERRKRHLADKGGEGARGREGRCSSTGIKKHRVHTVTISS